MKNSLNSIANTLRAKAELVEAIQSLISGFEQSVKWNEEYLKQEGISEYSVKAYEQENAAYAQKIQWCEALIQKLLTLE